MEEKRFPGTQFINLESNEAEWSMLSQGVLRELNFKATIVRDNKILTINLKIDTVIPPENHNVIYNTTLKSTENIDKSSLSGMERIDTFLSTKYNERVWFLFGEIKGHKPKLILIMYYEMFNFAIYTLKDETETKENFMPYGRNPN